jgi:tRNA(Arg) A34 adenosine deaminase TadA
VVILKETELDLLRKAIAVASHARQHDNHPFGAILVDKAGQIILEAENTVLTTKDCTGHAETNLIRLASQQYDTEHLSGCTLFTSTEPCPMCAGAIYWSHIGRVVYALSAQRLYELSGGESSKRLPHSRAILDVGGIEVIGPVIEDEAIKVHAGFWDAPERG